MFAPYAPKRVGELVTSLPAGFGVRPCTAHDLAAIASIVAQRSSTTFESCLKSVQEQFRTDTECGNLTLTAAIAGTVVGFGRARRLEAPTDGAGAVSSGWYLLGVIVKPEFRRRGIASELIRLRLAWIGTRADVAFYFANSLNLATIDLHRKFGFVEVRRPFAFPGAQFSGGGVGVLFRVPLRSDPSGED